MEERGRTMSKKDWIKIVVMPISIVILTAVLGNFIGIYLQNRSFSRNELFKAKLDLIMSGHKQTIDIMQDVDRARRQIRSNEEFIQQELQRYEKAGNTDALNGARKYYCEGSFMAPSIAILKEAKIKADSIGDYTDKFDKDGTVKKAIGEFSKNLAGYLECLDNKQCRPCSDGHENVIQSLRGVIEAHIDTANKLLDEYR